MAKIELEALPHREAIEYFRSKGFAPQLQRFHHLDHFREEHARNFVVAKAMRDDVLIAIRNELDVALAEGRTLQQFQADLKPRLVELGWWGKSVERDTVTGELQEVQLGSMRRLRTIFDTNMRTAHAAGHWARIQRTKRALPYLEYVQIERPTKRHDHARFHGKIWHADDPVWLRIYPPNGWFCGCTVIQRTAGWMARNGKSVSPPMDLEETPWTNKRTGGVIDLPRGIHPGFDTNPGATWLDSSAALDALVPDATSGQRASQRGIIDGLRLNRLRDGKELVVVADRDFSPVQMQSADPGTAFDPARFRTVADSALFKGDLLDAGPSFLDLDFANAVGARSITSVGPGGSLWHVAVTPDRQMPVPAPVEPERPAGLTPDDFDILVRHAQLLRLEREGRITYSFSASTRVRQLIEAYGELIEAIAREGR